MKRLRVHVVTHDDMDGFLWGIFEGWLITGLVPNQMEVRVSGPNTLLPQAHDFWETMPSTDAILLCVTSAPSTYLQRAVEVINAHGLWGRVIHHDYVHNDRLKCPKVAARAARTIIGKRLKWLRVKDEMPHAEWWPRNGLQERVLRYAPTLPWDVWKDIPVTALYHAFRKTGGYRRQIMGWVREIPGADVGTLHDPLELAPAALRRACGTRHSPPYFERLSRARIGVYIGGNALGHKFWDYAALRCVLLAGEKALYPPIHQEEDTEEWEHFARPLVRGEDYETFGSREELHAKVRALLADPSRCAEMADNCYRKAAVYDSLGRAERLYALLSEVQ